MPEWHDDRLDSTRRPMTTIITSSWRSRRRQKRVRVTSSSAFEAWRCAVGSPRPQTRGEKARRSGASSRILEDDAVCERLSRSARACADAALAVDELLAQCVYVRCRRLDVRCVGRSRGVRSAVACVNGRVRVWERVAQPRASARAANETRGAGDRARARARVRAAETAATVRASVRPTATSSRRSDGPPVTLDRQRSHERHARAAAAPTRSAPVERTCAAQTQEARHCSRSLVRHLRGWHRARARGRVLLRATTLALALEPAARPPWRDAFCLLTPSSFLARHGGARVARSSGGGQERAQCRGSSARPRTRRCRRLCSHHRLALSRCCVGALSFSVALVLSCSCASARLLCCRSCALGAMRWLALWTASALSSHRRRVESLRVRALHWL